MEILKKVLKNKIFWAGIFLPLIFQAVYFSIAIPAIQDGNTGINNLKIAIVNEDSVMGNQVAAQLGKSLPLKTEVTSDLAGSLDSMNNGDCSMVLHIAADFTAKVQQGNAQITYYINQAAPSMTKQLMERMALSINQTLNENAFNVIKNSLKQNSIAALGQAGLPDSLSAVIGANLSKAFDSLKYTSISSDIQKTNNAEGFIQTVFPFFAFLTYFVSCILVTVLHTLVFNKFEGGFSRRKIFLVRLITNIAAALIMPCIVIGIAAAFGIPFSQGTFTAWMLFSVGFFTLISLIQMFSIWFGIPGMGAGALILFPLQLVSSGLMYSREILPPFYSVISSYLPSTYFGDGMIKIFYGNLSVSKDVRILLLMSAIFIIISALSLLKPKNTPVKSSVLSGKA